MKKPYAFLRFIKWVLLGWLVAFAVGALLVIQSTNSYNRLHPSAYGVEAGFAKLNYMSIARRSLLRSGFSDTGWLLSSIENWEKGIYDEGMAKIPGTSTESLSWDYVFYIYPYKGGILAHSPISNKIERIKKASRIVMEYPERQIPTNVDAKIAAFEQIAESYSFATYDYDEVGLPSWENRAQLIIAGWKGFNLYAPYYPLTYKKNIGIYTTFSLRILGMASALTAHMWEEAHLNCTHPLIGVYRESQASIESSMKPLFNQMIRDNDTTQEKVNNANFHHLIKYQPLAEKILKEKCNIQLP